MKKEKIKKIIKEVVPYVIIVIVVVLIRTFIITPALVDGSSMEPTLSDKNLVMINKLNYKLNDIKRFDVVVLNNNNDKLIKRIIGLPGEHIEYKNNSLIINGFLIKEEYYHELTDDFKLESIGYLNIPGDKYFVVGDNRNNSIDSRMFGLVDKKDIIGNVNYRIFPLNKINKVK